MLRYTPHCTAMAVYNTSIIMFVYNYCCDLARLYDFVIIIICAGLAITSLYTSCYSSQEQKTIYSHRSTHSVLSACNILFLFVYVSTGDCDASQKQQANGSGEIIHTSAR